MDVTTGSPERISAQGIKNQQLIKVSPQSVDKGDKAAAKVASEFEALFVGLMLKSMRSASKGDALTDGGKGGEMYRSLLDQEYAKAVADSGSLGLAKIINQELAKDNQGKAAHAYTKNLQALVHADQRGAGHED